MPKSTDLRVIKTRHTIRTTLIALMSEKELSDITISELAERAQINRKTFYRHYSAIADVITEFEDELLADFAEILKSKNTSILDVGSVLREISALINNKQDYFVKLLKLNPELFSNGRVKEMLRRAVGISLREVCHIPSGSALYAISEYITSGVLSLYSSWFDNGCTGSLDLITDIANRMTMDGLKGFVHDEETLKKLK